MHITIRIKSVYGNDLIYPVCEVALLFAKLTGTKTLSYTNLKTIQDLGYEINIEQPVLEGL